MEMPAPLDWTQYKVGSVSTKTGWVNARCTPLTHVFHVAHLDVGLQICHDTTIRARLISDKSILRNERILVVWLSPNDWSNAGGFRYGNVLFGYEWRLLIDGKNYYQIEKIDYGIPALRILVTDKDYDKQFPRYDPKVKDGPWWYNEAENQHYWNGEICLEIMLEDDLSLKDASFMDFVLHHPARCSVAPYSCSTRGTTGAKAGAQFVAALTGNEEATQNLPLIRTQDNMVYPTSALGFACDALWERLSRLKVEWRGDIEADSDLAISLGRACLAAYARQNKKETRDIASLFKGSDEFLGAVARVVAGTFTLPDWENLTSDYWDSWPEFDQ